MEYTIENAKYVKHHVTVQKVVSITEDRVEELLIRVVRLRTLGGTPTTILLRLPHDIKFSAAQERITNISNLDDEIFSMLALHSLSTGDD